MNLIIEEKKIVTYFFDIFNNQKCQRLEITNNEKKKPHFEKYITSCRSFETSPNDISILSIVIHPIYYGLTLISLNQKIFFIRLGILCSSTLQHLLFSQIFLVYCCVITSHPNHPPENERKNFFSFCVIRLEFMLQS